MKSMKCLFICVGGDGFSTYGVDLSFFKIGNYDQFPPKENSYDGDDYCTRFLFQKGILLM